jgi:hypothetical protein
MTAAEMPGFSLHHPALVAVAAVLLMATANAAAPLGDLSANQPASTRAMITRINAAWQRSDPLKNFYLSTESIEPSRTAFAQASLQERVQLQSPFRFLLNAGDPHGALAELAKFEAELAALKPEPPPQVWQQLLTFKAVCHLRLGEQENCLHNHNADSCLFPIRGGGVHQREEGSRGAIAVLQQLLDQQPGDLRARWLLNIAYMTVGEYPARVPKKWLIDPKLFESDHDIKRFPDVAGALRLAVDDRAGGVVMDDFDNDGLLDLMLSASGPDGQIRVFRNNGDGTFADRTNAAGLRGLTGGLHTNHGDYNNDGFIDVLVLRTGWLRGEGRHPDSLLRNNGDFTFTDVTEEAGLLSERPSQTAAWFDYNGDGWIDIFVGNESSPGESHRCQLFRNNRDGTFTECASSAGLNLVKFVKGATTGDFNNDGRPDLYLSIIGAKNMLLRNDGPSDADKSPTGRWKFTDVATAAGVTQPIVSFPCWFWDYDNDGWQDLMVTGYYIQNAGDIAADYLGLPTEAARARLYRNNGDGTFSDVTKDAGLFKVLHTMGCNFGDLDNDGWLDAYFGTGDPDLATLIPSRMFRNDRGKRFQDVTTSGGFGQLQKGHGIAFGDIDNDGDQDVYSVVGGVVTADHYPNQLFANPGHGNRWLKLKLEGVTSNRAALGARIKVVVQTGDGERAIYKTVTPGASFGASPLRQEFGLGDARSIVRVEIFWPVTGVTQTMTGLALDRAYGIREGEAAAREHGLPTFALPTGADGGHHHHAH